MVDRCPGGSQVQQIAPFVARESPNLDEMLQLLSESLASNHQVELAGLWQSVPESLRTSPNYLLGLVRLGSMPDMNALFRGMSPRSLPAHTLRMKVLETLLARPFPDRFAGGWVAKLFASTHDAFGTTNHFTYSVIGVVDRLVRGVIEP